MMLNTEEITQPKSLFGPDSRWLKICLVIMFLLAALIRRDEIRAPGHLIEREYNSAIFARSFYMNGNQEVEQWQKDVANSARNLLPTLEPPVTEYLVSLIYKIAGREELWFARYLTAIFWLAGGIFLYKTVQTLVSEEAALVSVGYYLFAPWGIMISRSFQPDALMMMMFLLSLYCIVVYFKKPSWQRLLIASGITGITLLLRPLVLFTLFGAFIALSIHKKGKWSQVIDKQFIVFISFSLIFPLAFYGYGIYVSGSLQGQAALSFRPYLLTRWQFWRDWFINGMQVIGHPFVILAILGIFLLRDKLTRFLVSGLAAGYFFFGLFFTFHIQTHPYYHIQLLPIVGMSFAPLVDVLGNALKKMSAKSWWLPVVACFLIALFFSAREVRSTLYTTIFEDPKLASEIGEKVHHSPRAVFVSYHYGLPLEYYAQVSGVPWPVSIDDPFFRRPDEKELSVQERLSGLGFTPEYFIITHFDLFNRKHQDLKSYLERNCAVYAQTDQYLIYDSCQTFTINPSTN